MNVERVTKKIMEAVLMVGGLMLIVIASLAFCGCSGGGSSSAEDPFHVVEDPEKRDPNKPPPPGNPNPPGQRRPPGPQPDPEPEPEPEPDPVPEPDPDPEPPPPDPEPDPPPPEPEPDPPPPEPEPEPEPDPEPGPEPEPPVPPVDVKLGWAPPLRENGTQDEIAEYTLFWGYSSVQNGPEDGEYDFQERIAASQIVPQELCGTEEICWDLTLEPGVYYFAVTATDRHGNQSDFSQELEAIVE
jgi:hypothetical protein